MKLQQQQLQQGLGACHRILSDDLNISHFTKHSVPYILTLYQCDDCMNSCGDLIDNAGKNGTFLNRIITGDKTLFFLYDPQLQRQSATWKLPSSPRKEKQDRSKGKVMFEVFFDSVHMEFIPQGTNLNKHCYKEILCLCNSSCHKHPQLCCRKNWLLLQNNRSLFCHALHTHPIPHDAISFSFSALKTKLCGRQFQSAEEIVTATKEAVWDLPANIFQQCFQQLYQCWQICTVTNGD
jgi:hypothetical protein